MRNISVSLAILLLAAFAIVKIAKYFRHKIRKVFNRKKSIANEKSGIWAVLDKLKSAREQISTSHYQEFSKLLSETLRFYINFSYKISLAGTSEEIVSRLLANPKNDLTIISLGAEILKLTDCVKFSSRKLSIPQQRGLYKKACRFILFSERFFRSQKK